MFTCFEIILIIFLFILYIIIDDYHLYFSIIYLCLIEYTLYKISIKVSIWKEKLRFSSIIKIILSYIISYFIICDPNPIYYILTIYLPFQNYFRMIFVIIIITSQVEKLSTRDMEKYLFRFISNREEINEPNDINNIIDIHEDNNKDNINIKDGKGDKIEKQNDQENNVNRKEYINKYFLNDFLINFKKIKNIFLFIFITSIIQLFLFFYRVKFWIYFTPKEKALPIATAQNTKFYIASVVCNITPIIKDYINELTKLIKYLGTENVMVSIIENGDSRDKTRENLIEFQKYLNDSKIINEINIKHEICNSKNTFFLLQRIECLSKLRNRAFNLMYKTKKFDYKNTKIIFINDIIYTYEDIIKLLSTNNEDYDAVCAMDFYRNFYDTWASLDLNGNSFRHYYPHFINAEAQDQVMNLKPVRIFSCWGGVYIYSAATLENKKLQFRIEDPPKPTNYSLKRYQSYNIESECTYFNIDLQTLGYTKRFVNPDVKVAYEYKYYYLQKYFAELFHFVFYFYQYLWKFTEKRNKNMSNMRDKYVKLEKKLDLWYNYHKVNDT